MFCQCHVIGYGDCLQNDLNCEWCSIVYLYLLTYCSYSANLSLYYSTIYLLFCCICKLFVIFALLYSFNITTKYDQLVINM